ncbi:hypothetical protein Trydic_g20289, partial [Trypoxylus dichotomus]
APSLSSTPPFSSTEATTHVSWMHGPTISTGISPIQEKHAGSSDSVMSSLPSYQDPYKSAIQVDVQTNPSNKLTVKK